MKFRKANRAVHRDVGYFCSALILAYCISGIALNHVDDWNPDFIIHRDTIRFEQNWQKDQIQPEDILNLSGKAGHKSYKVYDFPTPDQVKIYFDQASLHVYLDQKWGLYEHIRRRPLFYQTNVLHRNSVQGWKWASDIFAILLITLNLTGVILLKGKYGISGRGKWFILLGLIPPLVVLFIQSL
ncbi:MAG: PepSY-associated TM helix domain-containing protein [Saprospiraceae bacterium]|nr:PepSY-associated TM helix domain-containing protein [Saprospiraceae bacterium]